MAKGWYPAVVFERTIMLGIICLNECLDRLRRIMAIITIIIYYRRSSNLVSFGISFIFFFYIC